MISTFSRAPRRVIALFALAVSTTFAVAAAPAAPGITYRMRMTMVPPDMPGMQMSTTVIVARGATIGTQSRLDIDSVVGQVPLAPGDYMLTLDSGRTVSVNPVSKTYSEGLMGLSGISPQLLAQASITNVNVTTEKLGAGETIQGYATEKVRMTTTYVMSIMGQSMNAMTVSEMSLAQLPTAISTPFDGTMPREMREGPMQELSEKMVAARKALGTATPLKSVNTNSMSSPMLPQALTTVMTVELLDVKSADVDPAVLKIPEGYVKK